MKRPDRRGPDRPPERRPDNQPARRSPRDARRAAVEALLGLAEDREGRVLTHLDVSALAPRDAALAREIALGVVRRRALLDHVCEGFAPRGLPPRVETRMVLRLGAYQLCFLDRIPPHAAVDSAVELCDLPARGFVNAILRRVASSVVPRAPDDDGRLRADRVIVPGDRVLKLAAPLPDPAIDPAGHLAVLGSLPRFLVERWLRKHGVERTAELVAACNRPAGVSLRTVQIPRDELAARLAAEGVETSPGDHPRVLSWTGGSSPFGTASYREGKFVAQDATAVAAAEALGAQRGETVLDLCAAPGTKATLLAEAVGSSGRVFAYDPDPLRRARIVDNVIRLGMPWLKIVEDPVRVADCDRVLVDVPCSNTGVLARRVEVRHRLSRRAIDELAGLQHELCNQALALVKLGGIVVYSTCSIEAEENEDLIAAVLAGGGVELVEERHTWPDPPRHDGGYYAVLRRTD